MRQREPFDAEAVLEFLRAGHSLAGASFKYGFSKQYLASRLAEHPDYEDALEQSKAVRAEKRAAERDERIKKLVPHAKAKLEAGALAKDIRALSSEYRAAVNIVAKEHPELIRRKKVKPYGRPLKASSKLLEDLKTVSGGVYITRDEYEKLRDDTQVSSQTISARFLTWRQACMMAGLKGVPEDFPALTGSRRRDAYSMDEAVAALYQCYRDLNRVPTSYFYRVWSTGREGVPSTRPIIKLFGGRWPSPELWMEPEDLVDIRNT